MRTEFLLHISRYYCTVLCTSDEEGEDGQADDEDVNDDDDDDDDDDSGGGEIEDVNDDDNDVSDDDVNDDDDDDDELDGDSDESGEYSGRMKRELTEDHRRVQSAYRRTRQLLLEAHGDLTTEQLARISSTVRDIRTRALEDGSARLGLTEEDSVANCHMLIAELPTFLEGNMPNPERKRASLVY